MRRRVLGTHVDDLAFVLDDLGHVQVVVGDEQALLDRQGRFLVAREELLRSLVGGGRERESLLGSRHPDLVEASPLLGDARVVVDHGVGGNLVDRLRPGVRRVGHRSRLPALNSTGTAPTA